MYLSLSRRPRGGGGLVRCGTIFYRTPHSLSCSSLRSSRHPRRTCRTGCKLPYSLIMDKLRYQQFDGLPYPHTYQKINIRSATVSPALTNRYSIDYRTPFLDRQLSDYCMPSPIALGQDHARVLDRSGRRAHSVHGHRLRVHHRRRLSSTVV